MTQPSILWTITILYDEAGYACEFTSADGIVGGMGAYANTPVGALAELCATLIKMDEDARTP